MSDVMYRDDLLAHRYLTIVAFCFTGHVMNFWVCISSLDMIGCGMVWQRILLHTHGILIHTGLASTFSHGFT